MFCKILKGLSTPSTSIPFSKNLTSTQLFYFRSSSQFLRSRKDFYQILGINRGASAQDIKKAYYTLAQKYHPDKNKAADAKEKFAEISSAYETLSDDNKRRVYDSTGMNADEQAQDPFGGFGGGFWGGGRTAGGTGPGSQQFHEDAFRGFEEFINMGMGGGPGMGGRRGPMKGSEIFLNLDLSFEESVRMQETDKIGKESSMSIM